MFEEFEGKTVVLSGSSRGLGYSIAEEFLKYGARVTVSGSSVQHVDSARQELEKNHDPKNMMGFVGDLTQKHVVGNFIGEVVSAFDKIDVVVANLGGGSGSGGWDIPEDEWQRMFDLNFTSARYLAESTIRYLSKNNSPTKLLFISSIAALQSLGAPMPYTVAKSALNAYAKVLAEQVAESDINVNVVSPGNVLFEGGSWDKKVKKDEANVWEYIAKEVPLNRFARRQEIVDTVLFLASSRSAFTTGANVVVDGGQTKRL